VSDPLPPRVVKAVRLTAEAFAPYGQVLQGTGPATERREFASRMQNGRPQARPNMTYMKVSPAAAPFLVRAVERHPFSNQTFVPLNGTPHLVAVCPSTAAGDPIVGRLQVFVASGAQAVNYDANVWHAPRTALGAPGEFIMFRWDDGGEQDTELRLLDVPIPVELPDR
jgi:ureidoglycolate lyase